MAATGKYRGNCRAGTNLVLLTPEAVAVFPTDQAVNEAPSSRIEATKRRPGSPGRRPEEKELRGAARGDVGSQARVRRFDRQARWMGGSPTHVEARATTGIIEFHDRIVGAVRLAPSGG